MVEEVIKEITPNQRKQILQALKDGYINPSLWFKIQTDGADSQEELVTLWGLSSSDIDELQRASSELMQHYQPIPLDNEHKRILLKSLHNGYILQDDAEIERINKQIHTEQWEQLSDSEKNKFCDIIIPPFMVRHTIID